jgi:hypothetical protein
MIGPHSNTDFQRIQPASVLEPSELPQVWFQLVALAGLALELGGKESPSA